MCSYRRGSLSFSSVNPGYFSEVVFRLAVWLIPLRKSSLSFWRSQADDLARWNWRNFMKMGIQNSLELWLWLKIDDSTSPSSSIEQNLNKSCPPRGSNLFNVKGGGNSYKAGRVRKVLEVFRWATACWGQSVATNTPSGDGSYSSRACDYHPLWAHRIHEVLVPEDHSEDGVE